MKINPATKIFKNKNSHWLIRSAFILLLFSIATANTSEAQTHNVLARFSNGNGGSPIDLVQGADGNFYGVGITGGK